MKKKSSSKRGTKKATKRGVRDLQALESGSRKVVGGKRIGPRPGRGIRH